MSADSDCGRAPGYQLGSLGSQVGSPRTGSQESIGGGGKMGLVKCPVCRTPFCSECNGIGGHHTRFHDMVVCRVAKEVPAGEWFVEADLQGREWKPGPMPLPIGPKEGKGRLYCTGGEDDEGFVELYGIRMGPDKLKFRVSVDCLEMLPDPDSDDLAGKTGEKQEQ